MKPVLLLLLSSCITIRAVSIDKKSALEAQFIGEYEELSDDLVTMASVRGQVSGFGLDGNDPYARALQARRLQAFYKDDMDRARTRGCVGESLDGHVKALPCTTTAAASAPVVPSAEPKLDRVVGIENVARDALVEYALAKNTQLSDVDRAALWQAYRRVVLSTLPRGALVENAQKQWVPHAP